MKSKIFASGDAFFATLFQDIATAKYKILIEMYKFNLSGIGIELANKLIEKAKQGVKITILVDGIGSKNWGGSYLSQMERAGIKTKIYHPIPWQFHQFKHAVSTLPTLKKIFYLLAKINTRNHRKIVIIDNQILYLGSINISDDHISQQDKVAWSDCAIRLQDSNAAQAAMVGFNRAFAPDFKNIYQGLQQTLSETSPIVLNNNLVKRKQNFRNLLKKIGKAKTRIWLVSAYFTPNNTLLRALTNAAKRGVDVRLILPKSPDVPFMGLAAKYFYHNLISVNVKIFEYLPTMIHSKYMIIDTMAMIGSSNLNHRSIMHDLEIDFKSNDTNILLALEEMFQNDQNNSENVANCNRVGFMNRLLYKLVIAFKIIL